MTELVVQRQPQLARLAVSPHIGERAEFAAYRAALLVALRQNAVGAGVSDDFVFEMTGNLLRALIPEQNLPLTVHHVNAHRQAVEDGAEDLRITKFRHRGGKRLQESHRRETQEL